MVSSPAFCFSKNKTNFFSEMIFLHFYCSLSLALTYKMRSLLYEWYHISDTTTVVISTVLVIVLHLYSLVWIFSSNMILTVCPSNPRCFCFVFLVFFLAKIFFIDSLRTRFNTEICDIMH